MQTTVGQPAGAPSATTNRGMARRRSLSAASEYREGGASRVYSGRYVSSRCGDRSPGVAACEVLGRVRGNLHARFLGGGGRVTVSLLLGAPQNHMRLWSLHPRYLDPQGLVALWREALLARAVLGGKTRGYRNHPQLERFRSQAAPRSAISSYLQGIHTEAVARGYSFDRGKVGRGRSQAPVLVTTGQVQYEWHHLLQKLAVRNPALYEQWRTITAPECHPLFRVQVGPIEPWERSHGTSSQGMKKTRENSRRP